MQWVSNGGSDSCVFVRVLSKELRFRIIIATPKINEIHKHKEWPWKGYVGVKHALYLKSAR